MFRFIVAVFSTLLVACAPALVSSDHASPQHSYTKFGAGVAIGVSVSRLGVGVAPPSAVIHARSDITRPGDLGDVLNLERNAVSAGGAKINCSRIRGTFVAPTATGIPDIACQWAFFLVNSTPAVQLAAQSFVTQDQLSTPTSTPVSTSWSLSDTTGTLRTRWRVDSAGHWEAPAGAASPSPSAGCGGAGLVVNGSDVTGNVTIGAAPGASCALTWNRSYNLTNPVSVTNCTFSAKTGADLATVNYDFSQDALTILNPVAAHAYAWTCIGY